ncbi:MAG: hypothetical protein Q8L87_12450 [Anaerolineales bacterium]|nr:hypothetical protein [Anaerolineales bacterium]
MDVIRKWLFLDFILTCRFHVHFSEVFHQQAVDEDVSATDAAQEDQDFDI